MRVALYGRVSKDNGKQDTENQLGELREFCQRSNWAIVHEYVDKASGKTADRPEFAKLFEDAANAIRFSPVLGAGSVQPRGYAGNSSASATTVKLRRGLAVVSGELPRLLRAIQGCGYLAYGDAGEAGEAADIRANQGRFAARETRGEGCSGRPRLNEHVQKLRRLQASGLSLRRIAAKRGSACPPLQEV